MLLAHPLIRERFPREPSFFDLREALCEFGKPTFVLRGNRDSQCLLSRPDGSVVEGLAECTCSPSGAGLDCLLHVLREVSELQERGLAELGAFLVSA